MCSGGFLFAFFVLFLKCFFVLAGHFGSSYLGKAQQPQEQRYPFLSVCAVFSMCPNNAVPASVGDV